MRRLFFILLLLTTSATLSAQEPEDEPTVGYVRVFTDTDLIEVYVDGALIGYTPILDKLILVPGWHTISYFPSNFSQDHWKYRQKKIIRSIIADGTRQVLVKPGELHEVNLEWRELDRRLRQSESNGLISSLVGVAMVGVTLTLLALSQ